MKKNIRKVELLAPARDASIAIEAINHGADAVYMGPPNFGARAMAGNSVADIAQVTSYAHQFNAKVYATVNTILYDSELKAVEKLICHLYDAGVDALIVQDMGILRLDIPPIDLHASTQCDLRSPEKAKFLASLGFSQLVLARELTLGEIKDIHHAVPQASLEAFVHGALCVSYSGRCQVSEVLKGRSANRGACAQVCRLKYNLEDESGNTLLENRHLLSLRDFNASSEIEAMLEAGVSSFKIEGRLKDASYVKNIVAHYRKRLDAMIQAHPNLYCRASSGSSSYEFEPNVSKSFNRSFTHYFLSARAPHNGFSMAATSTPKSMGEEIGIVLSGHGDTLNIESKQPLNNGDGLSYFDANGNYAGFRINRVEGHRVLLKEAVKVPAGATLYRTFDKGFEDVLSRSATVRKIDVDARLRYVGDCLLLSLKDERGNEVTHSSEALIEPAKNNQEARQLDALSKLGTTIYRLRSAQLLGHFFIPASVLTQLRREAIEWLDRAQRVTFKRALRHPEDKTALCFTRHLTYADNVANHLAQELYLDHGVQSIDKAIECERPQGDVPVMHTRYCLRRELGACRLDKTAKQLPSPLFLRSGAVRLRVECDCKACEMKIYVAQ
jgi:hypothetical protein